ncbi:MAG TPA: MBL fold metallo-hydrolase [Candidatus Hydrogenedentes bacterium]|nr:MBL fold metallo-hydrolase [Candidatus Hydrogenedentota bacterium]
MTTAIKITVVVDDVPGRPGLHPEHGLALWVETPAGAFLFDTGQGAALRENADALGIRLADVDTVVLSHGHYDHSGGLVHLLGNKPPGRIYAHPAAFAPRYRKREEPPHKAIGMPEEIRRRLQEKPDIITYTLAPQQILENVWITGPIPRNNEFEDTGGPFFTDPACSVPDPIEDDQAVWIQSTKGVIVLLGCAHAGVINTLDYIARLAEGAPLYTVIGGMHLQNANGERLNKTLQGLKRHHIAVMAPCHCTGPDAISVLRGQLPDVMVPCTCGSTFHLSNSGTDYEIESITPPI